MAHITFQTYLMWKDGATWKKLIDIRDFPDLQGDPNMLDITTLSDGEEKQTPGIKRASEKKFKTLYTRAKFVEILLKEETELEIALWIGGKDNTPLGQFGKFEGKGYPSVKILGKGVDEVAEMEITFAMTEPFVQNTKKTITAKKVWVGGDAASRPDIYFKLFQKLGDNAPVAVPGASVKKVTGSTVSWDNIESIKDGEKYVFSVKETNAGGTDLTPAGYTKVENGLTVTNTAE